MIKRVALAILLLLGQVTLITHQLDASAHNAGELCHICLHATPLDNLAVVTLDISATPGNSDVEPPRHSVSAFSIQRPEHHVRGPPAPFV